MKLWPRTWAALAGLAACAVAAQPMPPPDAPPPRPGLSAATGPTAAQTQSQIQAQKLTAKLADAKAAEERAAAKREADQVKADNVSLKRRLAEAEAKLKPVVVAAVPTATPTGATSPPGTALPAYADGPVLIALPTGRFQMGDAKGNADEKPTRTVSIKAFAMGEAEVTFAQWQACVDETAPNLPRCSHMPLAESGAGDQPVMHVSYKHITQQYLPWLNAKTRANPPYCLPTEAEWEYAARANTRTAWSHGDDEGALKQYAWYGANKTHAVKGLTPNAFKLYDMHGNVREWVQDCYLSSYKGAPSDGTAAGSAGDQNCRRVVRGGSRGSDPVFLRSASRVSYTPVDQGNFIGFRLARTLLTP